MIEIVRSCEQWPEEFNLLGAKIRSSVGDLAVSIHHIGSTSVPGLDAKDVIDIQMTVVRLDAPIDDGLHFVGFTSREEKYIDHCPPGMTIPDSELKKRMFGYQGRRVHLHVREAGRFNQRYALLCRDYLRSHPRAADAYAEIKRQLARYFPENVGAYYDIKDPVFDVLMSGAEDWAQTTNWQIPASDA